MPSLFLSSGLTALTVTILIIVVQGAEKEVVRIHARSVVAPMQNVHRLWHRAAMKFPRDPMRVDLFIPSLKTQPPVTAICH